MSGLYARWVSDYRRIGPGLSRKGGSTRAAYWAGYDGVRGPHYPPHPGTIAAAAYEAGRANREKDDENRPSTQGKPE